MLAFEELEQPPLQVGSQEVVDAVFLCVRDVERWIRPQLGRAAGVLAVYFVTILHLLGEQ